MKFYDRKDYAKHLKLLPNGYCPFCDFEWIRQNRYKILDDWIIAYNQYPYKKEWEGLQFLLFPIKHTTEFIDIPKGILSAMGFKYEMLGIKKYSMVWNNQEKNHSVKGHFHIHFFPEETKKIL